MKLRMKPILLPVVFVTALDGAFNCADYYLTRQNLREEEMTYGVPQACWSAGQIGMAFKHLHAVDRFLAEHIVYAGMLLAARNYRAHACDAYEMRTAFRVSEPLFQPAIRGQNAGGVDNDEPEQFLAFHSHAYTSFS